MNISSRHCKFSSSMAFISCVRSKADQQLRASIRTWELMDLSRIISASSSLFGGFLLELSG